MKNESICKLKTIPETGYHPEAVLPPIADVALFEYRAGTGLEILGNSNQASLSFKKSPRALGNIRPGFVSHGLIYYEPNIEPWAHGLGPRPVPALFLDN